MLRRAVVVCCAVALAVGTAACSSDAGRPVGGGPEKYEEPPDFQQHEGKDWKILTPTRSTLFPATTDADGTIPVRFAFSDLFLRYECTMDVGLQWLRLDGTASPRRDGIVTGRPVTENDMTIDLPVWPLGDDRQAVAGTTSSVSIEVRFVCPSQELDFHSAHTFRATFPALG